ncbi:SAM-dependent DNA methyltransferase, partial [Acidithiobacillus sp. MC6.1]|nr:SAM-dependent DNA methyltransferase [Acidithiobacillus sp. MC6.1]
LIFLKYISDAFAHRYRELVAEADSGADPEERDEYTAEGVFWVPQDARWPALQAAAKQTDIGTRIDAAMDAIERDNPRLKSVLPKGYARATLDQRRLGELVDLIGGIGLGSPEQQSKDTLGRVYEYFLSQFA